jgi:hypothetical protein
MSCPSHPSWFRHSSYAGRGVQLWNSLCSCLCPVYCFIPQNLSLLEAVEARKVVRHRGFHIVRSKHSGHPFLKHPHSTNISTFWDITPCSHLIVNRHFGETCRLHLQGGRINQVRNQHEAGTTREPSGRLEAVTRQRLVKIQQAGKT